MRGKNESGGLGRVKRAGAKGKKGEGVEDTRREGRRNTYWYITSRCAIIRLRYRKGVALITS